MLEKLLDLLGKQQERKLVGVVTGELLDEWKKHQCEAVLANFDHEAKKSTFALEFLRRHIVDGKLTIRAKDFNSRLSHAFEKENADYIHARECQQAELKRKRKELWDQTYIQLGIASDDEHDINVATGEVFEIGSGSGKQHETHSLH